MLQRQCLDRRLGDRVTMEQEVAAWVAARNGAASSIDWRFNTADARIKLKRLYPAVHARRPTSVWGGIVTTSQVHPLRGTHMDG